MGFRNSRAIFPLTGRCSCYVFACDDVPMNSTMRHLPTVFTGVCLRVKDGPYRTCSIDTILQSRAIYKGFLEMHIVDDCLYRFGR